MDCNEIRNLMIDRIDGNLDTELSHQVDEHLETCRGCQEEYIQVGNLLKKLLETEDEQPEESLKQGFYSMLQSETKKMAEEEDNFKPTFVNRKTILSTLKYAAAILIIFAIGFITGNENKEAPDNAEVAALKQEIESLKENSYLVSLNKPSASERLKVINTVSKSEINDKALILALVNTLNSDENANVRLAAAYALAKFPKNEYVRTSLIHSLEIQTEPIVQISLIGILIDFKDNRAKAVIEKLIENDKVLPEVKQQAMVSLSVFV